MQKHQTWDSSSGTILSVCCVTFFFLVGIKLICGKLVASVLNWLACTESITADGSEVRTASAVLSTLQCTVCEVKTSLCSFHGFLSVKVMIVSKMKKNSINSILSFRDRKVLINRTTAVPVTAKSKKSYLELSAIEVINHWSYQPLKISAIEISFSLKLDLKAMRVLMCFETYKKKTSLSSFISSRDLVLDFVFLRGYG